jgi:hypothetical protein
MRSLVRCDTGEKQVPRCARDETEALAPVAGGGSKDPPLPLAERVKEHKRGTVLAGIGGQGSLQDERFGIFGESRGGEAHYLTKRVYQSDDCHVNKIQVVGPFDPRFCRSLAVVFEVIQRSKRENRSGGRKCQGSRASQGLPPIRRCEEK